MTFFVFEFGQRAAQRGGLVGSDPLDEMHQRGFPTARVGGLVERVDHQPGDEFVATTHGCVAVCPVIAVLCHEVFFASRCRTFMTVV